MLAQANIVPRLACARSARHHRDTNKTTAKAAANTTQAIFLADSRAALAALFLLHESAQLSRLIRNHLPRSLREAPLERVRGETVKGQVRTRRTSTSRKFTD
jgi:dsRNA-specific ribonuclease